MASDYELIRYLPDFKSQVIGLQTHMWSSNPDLNRAYFEWKYERNPYLDKPLIYLALHDGKPVGMRGFFGVKWEVGVPTQRFVALYADDSLVAPGHRNRGLMPKIMATAFADLASGSYDYVFNLSAGPMTFLTSLSMAWRSAGSFQPMYWRSWRATTRSGLSRAFRKLPVASHAIDRLLSGRSPKAARKLAGISQSRNEKRLKGPVSVSVEETPRCAAMAELIERIGSSGRMRHVRDTEYFRWRFQNPLSRYRFLFWEKDRLEGYLVLQEYTSDFGNREVLNIVDWEASNETVKAELLQTAFKVAGQRSLNIWSATLDRKTTQVLVRSGFKASKKDSGVADQCPAILVRSLREQKVDDWRLGGLRLTDVASWDIRMLYSMAG